MIELQVDNPVFWQGVAFGAGLVFTLSFLLVLWFVMWLVPSDAEIRAKQQRDEKIRRDVDEALQRDSGVWSPQLIYYRGRRP